MSKWGLTDFDTAATRIHLLTPAQYESWRSTQPTQVQNWIKDSDFQPEPFTFIVIPDGFGKRSSVVTISEKLDSVQALAALPARLPAGKYRLSREGIEESWLEHIILSWVIGSYRFDKIKSTEREAPRLCWPEGMKRGKVEAIATALSEGQDMINLPANLMTPRQVERLLRRMADELWVEDIESIKGTDLENRNFPLIWAVGRASEQNPRLLDLTWGYNKAPQVTIIGKGVCFDTGGLNLKPPAYMYRMKKDMGGAASAMALARMIMSHKLDVYLRVLLPVIENSVDARSYRPGDVLTARNEMTIEVGDTDAEGRLILADALSYAIERQQPDLMIDFATLTGAARVALGTDVPAFYCGSDALAADLMKSAETTQDPLWRLPLHQPYMDDLKSDIADLHSTGSDNLAGSIRAALFLSRFAGDAKKWLHIDTYCWNDRARPDRPKGAVIQGVRAVFDLLERRYGRQKVND